MVLQVISEVKQDDSTQELIIIHGNIMIHLIHYPVGKCQIEQNWVSECLAHRIHNLTNSSASSSFSGALY